MAKKKATVVSIVGARPQFVKLAPLAARLKKSARHVIIHSGQHYDHNMSDAFFGQLRIPAPDVNLGVGSGGHGRQTGRIMERLEPVLSDLEPALVLVYGDTNTTLAGAVTAAKLLLPTGHVEAGLRSFRRDMPEEINRVVADHLADLLFYPTPTARKNLVAEGVTRGLVRSGDVMYEILDAMLPGPVFRRRLLKHYDLAEREYFLITLHRAENTDDPERLRRFVTILKRLPGDKLFLMHPRTAAAVKKHRLGRDLKAVAGLRVEAPMPYRETLGLLESARGVLTDSGGLQKEAYFLGTPCLTLRRETEWVETIAAGANTLVDLSPARVRTALAKRQRPRRRLRYTIGGKKPSRVICDAIAAFLKKR